MNSRPWRQYVLMALVVLLAPCSSYITPLPVSAQQTSASALDDPSIALAGQFGGITTVVAHQGDYAYIGVGSKMVILNVSDVNHPTLIGQSAALPDMVRDILVVGNTVYVTADTGGLYIMDVSNPASPAAVGSYDTPGRAFGVAVAGDRAYIADGEPGLRTYDWARQRVVESRDGLPGPEAWLLARRSLSEPSDIAYFLSNAPTGNNVIHTAVNGPAAAMLPAQQFLALANGLPGRLGAILCKK